MLDVKSLLLDLSTDYKIRSTRILGGCIISTFCVMTLLFLAELIFDLKASTEITILPFLALNTALLIGYLMEANPRFLGFAWVATQFAAAEFHFFYNPATYHVILFWLAIGPIGAMITNGIRHAYIWLVIVILTILFNAYYGELVLGETYEVTIHFKPFIAATIIFILAMFSSMYLLYMLLGNAFKEKEKSSQDLNDKKLRLEKYQNALIGLSKDKNVSRDQLESLFERICTIAVENLEVSRVSVWTVSQAPQSLNRKYLFETSGGTDELVVLHKNDFPRYFSALETKPFIAADDARTHLSTSEFTETYLKPLHIYSMLDSSITIDGDLIGVICCEHQHHMRMWTAEDILFIQSLADIIALGLKTFQINNLLKQIRSQNHELIEKQNEIESLNEELHSSNEELTTINESLEEAVNERTKELEQQNVQLTEYAFINSHLLRAPLSRILGLCQLLNSAGKHDPTLYQALIKSSEELDTIIRKISDLLYDGRNFSREQIKDIIDRNFNKLDNGS
jgi:biopolymer transport protein ExbB/TolQ